MKTMSLPGPTPRSNATVDDARWAQLVARDPSADGRFWYSVATTGIYCRPTCPSRLPNPGNVTLHDSLEGARSTGARACKRCKPDGPSRSDARLALVTQACRIIDGREAPPSLAELAAAAGLSAGHFHRAFKGATGLTPKAYAAAQRARRLREGLADGRSVTQAIYDAGFNSSGRFYEKARDILGMSPSSYRAGGQDEEIRFAVGQSSLGALLVAASAHGVVAILIGDDPEPLVRDLQDRFPAARLVGGDPEFERTVACVVGFVEAPTLGLDLPLDVRGTAFQQRVWQALRKIPPGRTVSYGGLAARVGAPRASRAVARACAANPISVAIPCHRVVRADGAVSGYRWGVERKQRLIALERVA